MNHCCEGLNREGKNKRGEGTALPGASGAVKILRIRSIYPDMCFESNIKRLDDTGESRA